MEIPLYKDKECKENYPLICIKNNKCKNYIGKLIVNGYSIIKNPFYFNGKDIWDKNYLIKNVIETTFGYKNKNNNWIFKYWDWLKEYFKDEPEILVLKIESWEE